MEGVVAEEEDMDDLENLEKAGLINRFPKYDDDVSLQSIAKIAVTLRRKDHPIRMIKNNLFIWIIIIEILVPTHQASQLS